MSPGRVVVGIPPDVRESAVRLAGRVYWRRLARLVRAAGLDEEDGAQEAAVGVLARLGSWRAGGGAPLEWWVARSAACAIQNWITLERRSIRMPPGGISSLTTEAGGEIQVAGAVEPVTAVALDEVLAGMGLDELAEVGVALRGRG